MRKLPYKQGTWFGVPLRDGGFAVGLVARHVPKSGKIILAYFFGPKRESLPTLGDLEDLAPQSAVKVIHVGDLRLMNGTWPILGDSPNWKREEWPMPAFIRRDDILSIAWRVEYADDNPNQVISEQRIPYDSVELERDEFYGAGAAEIALTRILA